jgi:hypothetical protein
MLIDQVVKRLDGRAREFDVIPLRRLIAEDVAGTINMMMGTEEEEDEQQNRYSYFYYNPRGNSEEKSKDKFRVTANAYDNQLLIWANEIEREEVNKLLVKLGEILPDGGSGGPFRTIDAARSPETYEYLQRIKEQWAKISDTPLELPNRDLFESSDDSRPPSASSKESDQEEDTPQSEKDDESSDVAPDVAPEVAPEVEEGQPKPIADTENKITATGNISFVADQEGIPRGRLLQTQTSLTTESRPDRSTSVAAVSSENAIRIGLDARGNLILYSEDTEALNALESLMLDIAPPARPYQVIHVQHQTATWITFDLEDYFKDLETDESNQDPREAYYRYIFDLDSGQSKKKPAQLGRKRPLRFIPNNDTQTILVIGADDETLEVIERLVALWDVPDKVDDSRVRYTQIVAIKYSRAELIVETMKEAFRDLLSSNDKAFEKKNDRGGGESGESAGDTSSVTSEGGMNFSFSGRLSFGVDKVTNSILVSCEKQLLELLVSTIERLDEAAKPSANIEVHEVELGGNESLKKALQAILGQRERNPAVPDPNAQPGQNNPNGQLQNNVLPMNNNGGRGSSRRE